MKKGDHIRFKNGTNDPDFKGKDLSGYTGYIESISSDDYVEILWDKSTLETFDAKFMKKCDRNNLDYTRIFLTIDEIEVIDDEPK